MPTRHHAPDPLPVVRSVTPIGPVALAVAWFCLTPVPGQAQSVLVSPRVSVMDVMDGDDRASSLGLRGEVGSSALALYGQGGMFLAEQRCETSLPPSCSTPSSLGVELLGGVRFALPRLGVAHPAISLGAGALIWDDDTPHESGVGSIWEVEVRVGVKALSWSDLILGTTVKSIGQSVTGGMQLFRERGTYVGIMVGLLIPGTRHAPSSRLEYQRPQVSTAGTRATASGQCRTPCSYEGAGKRFRYSKPS